MRNHIETSDSYLRIRSIEDEDEKTREIGLIAAHLWNIAMMLGFPWSVLKSSSVDDFGRSGLMNRFPMMRAFDIDMEPKVKDLLLRGGWFLKMPGVESVLGPDYEPVMQMIYRMMSWDPDMRPTPGSVIETFADTYFWGFMGIVQRENENIPNPRSVDPHAQQLAMKGTSSTNYWSLVKSSISYHVDISGGPIMDSPTGSRFTAPLKREQPIGGGLSDRLSQLRVSEKKKNREKEEKKEEGDWKRWL